MEQEDNMSVCCCSLAGTAACQHCRNNPMATDVWSNTVTTDRIRSMSDEELEKHLMYDLTCGGSQPDAKCDCIHVPAEACEKCWLEWLKQDAEEGK